MWPVLHALLHYGDRHLAPHGPPMLVVHTGCGGTLDDRRMCTTCGKALERTDVIMEPGPGAAATA